MQIHPPFIILDLSPSIIIELTKRDLRDVHRKNNVRSILDIIHSSYTELTRNIYSNVYHNHCHHHGGSGLVPSGGLDPEELRLQAYYQEYCSLHVRNSSDTPLFCECWEHDAHACGRYKRMAYSQRYRDLRHIGHSNHHHRYHDDHGHDQALGYETKNLKQMLF